ncbi:MAG: DNA primase small subunit domain-containing protein [Candidatus Helarchaeota archaeon]
MIEKSINRQKFLAEKFRTFYVSKFKKECNISDIEYREFGFFYWEPSKFVRHLRFINIENLAKHIISKVPKHIYSSAARYEVPNAPNMKLKSLIDCELIFDLDVDHIPTPCKKDHDKWVCKQCGTTGTGMAPKTCPAKKCESHSFEEMSWECEKCMEIAKSEIFSIIEEFLSNDFGLNPKTDLFIVFSGRRGYHIHIENEIYRKLDSNARREIVDYIMGKGLVPSYHGFSLKSGNKPNKFETGWRGRMTRFVIKFLKESSPNELLKILTRRVNIINVKKDLVAQLNSRNPSWSYPNIGEQTWVNLINAAIEKYGAKVDQPVTIDLHRLIRLPGSLHGKTGFLVKKMSYNELEKFDPFSHAQVFEGSIRVHVHTAPQFRIGNENFGPFKDQKIELPMSAAIYLLCKGVANLL